MGTSGSEGSYRADCRHLQWPASRILPIPVIPRARRSQYLSHCFQARASDHRSHRLCITTLHPLACPRAFSLLFTTALFAEAANQPLLARTTVTSLILEAVGREEVLSLDADWERLMAMLEALPWAVWGRYGGMMKRWDWDVD